MMPFKMQDDSMTLAWAYPVDPVVLGGRLHAYYEYNKEIITFSQCCAKMEAKLPPEILDMITDMLKDNEEPFENFIKDQLPRHRCITYTCKPSEHLTEDEIESLDMERNSLMFERECDEWVHINPGVSARHTRTAEEYLPCYAKPDAKMQEAIDVTIADCFDLKQAPC